MNQETMKNRTKLFAKNIIYLCRSLPHTREAFLIEGQLFRSGTSVGANYRAACRSRSKAEFTSKLHIALEEADESLFWLEIIHETGISGHKLIKLLMKEANELISILVTSINTTNNSKRFRSSISNLKS